MTSFPQPVSLYTNLEQLDTEKGFLNDQEITTACVEAVILARTDTDEDILESVSDALLNYKQTLVK